jgi:hypothetical protein
MIHRGRLAINAICQTMRMMASSMRVDPAIRNSIKWVLNVLCKVSSIIFYANSLSSFGNETSYCRGRTKEFVCIHYFSILDWFCAFLGKEQTKKKNRI